MTNSRAGSLELGGRGRMILYEVGEDRSLPVVMLQYAVYLPIWL